MDKKTEKASSINAAQISRCQNIAPCRPTSAPGIFFVSLDATCHYCMPCYPTTCSDRDRANSKESTCRQIPIRSAAVADRLAVIGTSAFSPTENRHRDIINNMHVANQCSKIIWRFVPIIREETDMRRRRHCASFI